MSNPGTVHSDFLPFFKKSFKAPFLKQYIYDMNDKM